MRKEWFTIKRIKGVYHINNTDYKVFNEEFFKSLDMLQDDKQEVEIQYKTNTFPNGQMVYSALLLGRVDVP